MSTVLSILNIVKHRLHVRNLRTRCGPERRESWPRQYSLPFIAAINRHYDYHTQYVDIFTKWGARFISKYQNRPLPSTSCYFSRLSNVLIPRPVSCMVIVVSVGLPGVQGFYRFYTHPFIYYLHTSTSRSHILIRFISSELCKTKNCQKQEYLKLYVGMLAPGHVRRWRGMLGVCSVDTV